MNNANNLMLQSALRRLDHWKVQLEMAIDAADNIRATECTRFIAEYRTLITEMTAVIDTVIDLPGNAPI